LAQTLDEPEWVRSDLSFVAVMLPIRAFLLGGLVSTDRNHVHHKTLEDEFRVKISGFGASFQEGATMRKHHLHEIDEIHLGRREIIELHFRC
jgi:hypothetical protein